MVGGFVAFEAITRSFETDALYQFNVVQFFISIDFVAYSIE